MSGMPTRYFPWPLNRLPLRSTRAVDGFVLALVVALLPLAYAIVHATGGTRFAWPYVMLVPVMVAAARFRVLGGVLAGLAGGLLLGPPMPLDVAAGTPQDPANWLVRMAFFTALGGFTGALFHIIQRTGRERARDARTDTDSGLPNRTALIESLEQGVLDRRSAPLLILARVVDLGEIMEAVGVGAADQLMGLLASRLREDADAGFEIYRFSAAEIALVRHRPAGSDALDIERLQEITQAPAELQGVPVHVELAFGSADAAGAELSAREILRRARVALFAAIERQRGHCHYAPEYEHRTTETIRLLAGVRRGIERGEFELHFQPKFRAATGEADGCEALVRWRDPADGSLIPPGKFMPRVERSALIGPLTRFVAESAFAFVAQAPGRVSINITARDLLDADLIAAIARMAVYGGTPAERIEIEITEGAIVRDPVAAREAIGQLRRCGFRVSIDDFGTGYSSFEYLRLLPLTGLKIDRAFVRDLESDPKAERLMGCMIEVGHALDLEVVAEGVETRGQVDILRRLDCDLLQGFYFAHPMPQREYLQRLSA